MNEDQPQQTPQQQNQESAPRRSPKPLIISLVVVALLAVTGYAVYAWQQREVDKLEAQVKSLQEEAKSSESTDQDAVADDSYAAPSGYLEYTVTKPDFSFAYPKSIGSLTLTTENLNDSKYKGRGVKGTSITIAPTTNTANNDNTFRVLTASTDYVPFGGDDPLAVYTIKGYTKSGSIYSVPLGGDKVISDNKDFEVVATRSGEAVVFSAQNQGDGTSYTAIGIVNLPSSTGYKAIGFTANSIAELKSILATVKIGD